MSLKTLKDYDIFGWRGEFYFKVDGEKTFKARWPDKGTVKLQRNQEFTSKADMSLWSQFKTVRADEPAIVKVRVIGALIIEDEHGDDPKILSVLVNDARFSGYNDIQDVHKHKLKEIQEFYETYKRLEPHKWVKFKEWKSVKDAKEIVEYSMNLFKTDKLKEK